MRSEKRLFWILGLLILGALLISACQPETLVVTQVVTEIVEIEGEEVVVTEIIEVEVTAVPPPPGPDPKEGGDLVIGFPSEPSKIDPHRTASAEGLQVIMQAAETLVNTQPDGEFGPGLATSWEVSDDGLAYTFHLREGINFHDGTPFNAEAVKYNFDRVVDPETQSEEAIDRIGDYDRTEVIDEYTAVVHLNEPFAPFLDGISLPNLVMVSPTAAEEWGVDDFQDHFVGTGPFIFKEWVRQEQIVLEKNPDYWGGPDFFEHQGLAYLDTITFKIIPEASVLVGALETGEIHMATNLPGNESARLAVQNGIDVIAKPSPGMPVNVLFNVNKAPTDDILVRQALIQGIDQKALADTLYAGIHGPAYGVQTPISRYFWEGAEDLYPYDPESANALLDEAGWVMNEATGIREKDGAPLVLDLPTHSGFPRFRDPVPIIQAQLREIGADVNSILVPSAGWLEAGRSGEAHMHMSNWGLRDPGFNFVTVFLSDNSTSFAWNHHTNDRLDSLVEQGMVTSDQTERAAIYEELQQIVMEDAMMAPLHEHARVYGMRSNVMGFDPLDPDPTFWWLFDTYLEE